jgi:hypothetical protein
MLIRVESYAGYRDEQEPVAFWSGDKRVAVRAVLDRWYSPSQRWFKVEADDGDTYILRRTERPVGTDRLHQREVARHRLTA